MADQDRTDKVRLRSGISQWVMNGLHGQRRRMVLWLPVLWAIGIAVYFGLAAEPAAYWGWAWLVPLAGMVFWRRLDLAPRMVLLSALAVTGGFAAAQGSAHRADLPRIAHPTGETVEGRVLWISRSASGAPRILLDRLVIYGVEPDETPRRVRLTLLDQPMSAAPPPGTRVRVYATLMPTGLPVEPGAFDFNRRAFFEHLGGVGLARGTVLQVPVTEQSGVLDRAYITLLSLRDSLSKALRAAIDGRGGAFAAAIIVGDRADIPEADAEALRASNLAHLLAISGLHMGILSGLIFAIARIVLAAIPWTAHNLSTKKTAAVLALCAAAGYLGLSGATVATQRAFLMVAVALVAVLLDRPAITLRGLAVAGFLILAIRPISLMDAGFQMSFSATLALVAGYEALRERGDPDRRRRKGKPVWAIRIALVLGVYVGGILVSSILAGGATAPYAAFHFNRTAPYGLIANLLALPIMGFWIAPLACLAAVAAPFGLAVPVLQLMGLGIEQILVVAHWVAALPGAVHGVAAAEWPVLACLSLGGLWLAIWRGPVRWMGTAGLVAGLALWWQAPPRPDLLVSAGARLIGVMGPQGRVLDHDRAQSFAAETWLRRDGDLATQMQAAARPGLRRSDQWLSADLPNGWTLAMTWRRDVEPAELTDRCRPRTLLIARQGQEISGACEYFGADALRRSGAIAVWFLPDGPQVRTVVPGHSQRRMWD